MGTIFIAGVYGVGKSTLCSALSNTLGIPAFSVGDLISEVNGEQYGANKAVKNKERNQDILAVEVRKKLDQYPTILLAGHFCIFDKSNCVKKLPYLVFKKLNLEQVLLLEAMPKDILLNLISRDKKEYKLYQIERLLSEERRAAEDVSKLCSCKLHIHQMAFDSVDLQKCKEYIIAED